MKKNSNNDTCFYGPERSYDGGNQLVAEIQALRAQRKALPSESPQSARLREREQTLKTELYHKVERLLQKNANGLYKKVKGLPFQYSEPEDFVQDGAVAFLNAIDQFKLNQETKFSTLVRRFIVTAMTDKARHETHYNHHKRKSDEEGTSPRKRKPKIEVVSLEAPAAQNKDGEAISYRDTVADQSCRSPLDTLIDEEQRQKAALFKPAARGALPQARVKTFDDYVESDCVAAETARRQKRSYTQVYNEIDQIRKTLRRDLGGFNPAA